MKKKLTSGPVMERKQATVGAYSTSSPDSAMASSSKITLDVEQLPATAVDTLLSYPSLFDDASSTTPLPQPRTILKEKLYVGNLHPTVDEYAFHSTWVSRETNPKHRYTLIKLFSQYGQVSHLDFLFHKTGPHKGKPRGYAFVEFANSHVSVSYACIVIF